MDDQLSPLHLGMVPVVPSSLNPSKSTLQSMLKSVLSGLICLLRGTH
jgi:hypothetical protein